MASSYPKRRQPTEFDGPVKKQKTIEESTSATQAEAMDTTTDEKPKSIYVEYAEVHEVPIRNWSTRVDDGAMRCYPITTFQKELQGLGNEV